MTNVLTPELRAEIEQHLRANPIRHGEVFRDMERGLSADQMATSRLNATNFMRSVEAMLAGTLPTTRSAALINSYGYRYLLTCNLSPELHIYVKAFLRRLAAINPEVRRLRRTAGYGDLPPSGRPRSTYSRFSQAIASAMAMCPRNPQAVALVR